MEKRPQNKKPDGGPFRGKKPEIRKDPIGTFLVQIFQENGLALLNPGRGASGRTGQQKFPGRG